MIWLGPTTVLGLILLFIWWLDRRVDKTYNDCMESVKEMDKELLKKIDEDLKQRRRDIIYRQGNHYILLTNKMSKRRQRSAYRN